MQNLHEHPIWLNLIVIYCAAIALIHPLFIEGSEISNMQNQVVARLCDVCSPEDLLFIQPHEQTNDLVINFKGEWQVCLLLFNQFNNDKNCFVLDFIP